MPSDAGVPSTVIAPLIAISLLLAGAPPVLGQDDTTRIAVSGLVADVQSGEPLAGAVVSLPDAGRRTLTNEAGRFVLFDLPAGEQRWEIRHLGYATWEQSLAATNLDQLRIGLLPRPIALENIKVTVDRLERRRRLVGVSVHTVSEDEVTSLTATSAAEAVVSHMPRMTAACPASRGVGATGESYLYARAARGLCIRWRGDVIRPRIWLDERPVPFAVLEAYLPDEIHTIEFYQGGSMVRVYTHYFIERGGDLRPVSPVIHW